MYKSINKSTPLLLFFLPTQLNQSKNRFFRLTLLVGTALRCKATVFIFASTAHVSQLSMIHDDAGCECAGKETVNQLWMVMVQVGRVSLSLQDAEVTDTDGFPMMLGQQLTLRERARTEKNKTHFSRNLHTYEINFMHCIPYNTHSCTNMCNNVSFEK